MRHWIVGRSLLVSLGLAAGAHAEYVEPSEAVLLWREWMSEIQREASQTSTPRIYIMTDREILQTGKDTAKFQSGRYRMMVADGGVPDVDGDLDFYTDVFEDGNAFAWRDDPELIPRDGMGNPLPPDALISVLLANGQLLNLATSTLGEGTPARTVRPKTGGNVRMVGAPASNLQRPLAFRDFSTEFYYFFVRPGQTVGEYLSFPLSLYHVRRDFPNPGDGNALETTLVPGEYTVEYPTIVNAPTGKGFVKTAHRLVPNGSLTVGLKKPTWLIRTLASAESSTSPPVQQKWVNGRLKFDPYLPTTINWDPIAQNGLASGLDFIDVYMEDDDTGQQISFSYRLNATNSSLSFDNSSAMKLVYGDFPSFLGLPSPPLSVNASIVMKYNRYANGQSSADLSTVTVRVPVELTVTYPSWRNEWFPSEVLDNSISGPNADPDKDGLTNQQEFEQGSNPTVPAILVSNPLSSGITANGATLGATVETDPFSGLSITIFERGIIYSATSTNSQPVLDGTGVVRVPAPPAEPGSFTVDVGGLAANTKYSYRGYVITNLGPYYSTPTSTFTTLPTTTVTLPSVTSPFFTGLTGSTVTLGGTVTSNGGSSIVETGVVYSVTSTNDNPFIGGSGVTQVASTSTGTGTFSVNIAGLSPSTTYSFRAYAINSVGTRHTTTIGTFSTASGPIITSPTVTDVTVSSARLGGTVTSSGGLAILQRGVVFSSTTNNPVVGGAGSTAFVATTSGLGTFTVNVSGLQANTQYFFKAFATNSIATSYTSVGTFTTSSSLATLTSPTIEDVTATSALIGATITSDGQSPVTERGFVYSQTSVNGNPLIGGTGVTQQAVGSGTGQFELLVTGLTENTGYTFRAYAINGAGVAYGAPYAFFTTLPPLTVTDPTVTDITEDSATVGGTVVSDEGTTVDERGVVLNTDPLTLPEIGGPGVIQVTGTGTMGVFTVDATGLDPDTQYFFRAYATNASGTSYSEVSDFTTESLVLLGLSEVGWLSQAQPLGEGSDGETPQTETETTAPVPQFVYEKSELDSDGLVYSVEVSSDSMNWEPAGADWSVVETAETITATWESAETAPTRLFFRVKGSKP